jgi:regulator of replication initiation timing
MRPTIADLQAQLQRSAAENDRLRRENNDLSETNRTIGDKLDKWAANVIDENKWLRTLVESTFTKEYTNTEHLPNGQIAVIKRFETPATMSGAALNNNSRARPVRQSFY